MLNRWAGSVRFLYNKTIALLTNPKNKTLRSKFRLRNRFATIKNQKTKKTNSFYNNKPWLKDCPNSVRQGAIYDAKANLTACFSNLKAKNIDHFDKPFRTKKKERQRGWAFSVEKQNIQKKDDKLMIFETILGEMKYCGKKQLHKLLPGKKPSIDCKIQKTAFGEYFLIIPFVCVAKPIKS